jgi:hypothetical protein
VSKFLRLLEKYAYILFEVIQARNEPKQQCAEHSVTTVDWPNIFRCVSFVAQKAIHKCVNFVLPQVISA